MTANIYQFGVRDDAASRQEIVNTLNRLIQDHDELKIFPSNLKLALEERVWEKERRSASGKIIPPTSLHEFIHERYPVGISATYELVENLIRGRADVLAVWVEVTKRKPGAPQGNRNAARSEDETNGNNVTVCLPSQPKGNSSASGMRKLQKAASEGNEKAIAELARVIEGEKSVHRACIDAGLRKEPTTLEQLTKLWGKASASDRAAFDAWRAENDKEQA